MNISAQKKISLQLPKSHSNYQFWQDFGVFQVLNRNTYNVIYTTNCNLSLERSLKQRTVLVTLAILAYANQCFSITRFAAV